MTFVKDAGDYAISMCSTKNYNTPEKHAAALYMFYSENLRAVCGSPYVPFSNLSKETKNGWIEHAKKLRSEDKENNGTR